MYVQTMVIDTLQNHDCYKFTLKMTFVENVRFFFVFFVFVFLVFLFYLVFFAHTQKIKKRFKCIL